MEETRRLEDCLNEFSAVIRDNFLKSPAVFYDQNLRKLVEFLNAAQGVIFVAVRDYEGVKLKAVAAYAFHTDVKMIKTVTPGDGLVGQAYKSARTFYFDRMPVNTFEIKSALAAIQPFATVVQPLIDNAQVRGVVQLALTRPLEDWERAFLERYSGQLAAAIAGIQAKTLEQAA
jgi:GAF domain-containing protein